MAGLFVDPQILREAVLDRRFAGLARAGTDLATISTWNPRLSRRYRILVPADVQAYVVTVDGNEETVDLTGDQRDPAPFAAGAVKPAGVHLHWAMPDALLRGRNTAGALSLPPLPDLWVLARAVLPVGQRRAALTGWVIDASTGSLTDLASFAGTPGPAPAGTQVLDPVDGASGGSPHWTASYAASAGRFTFHDPLTDIAAAGELFGNQAVYSVAGWWSDLAGDPLGAAEGMPALDQRLAELGWRVVHDGDDEALSAEDPRLVRVRSAMGLEQPSESAPVHITGADGRRVASGVDAVRFDLASPVAAPQEVFVGPALPRYATLVHGSVLGVPVAGALPSADDRPDQAAVGLALGMDIDDVAAAFAAAALQLDAGQRRSAETLVAAFTGGLLEQLGQPDGLDDLAEHEHEDGFWPLAGADLPAAKPDRLRAEDSAAAGPLKLGRKGRAASPPAALATSLDWARSITVRDRAQAPGGADTQSRPAGETVVAASGAEKAASREVVRPAPRYFRPQAPMLALRGAKPNHRHHGDGLYDAQGLLLCRYPKECVPGIDGVVSGADVVPTLGSGAIPDEALTLVREAVVLNPYGYQWLAAAGAPDAEVLGSYTTRIAAEMVLLYGAEGAYDGSSHLRAPVSPAAAGGPWGQVSGQQAMVDRQLAQELARHSLLPGTLPSPVALTTWRQPWVPLWVEWRVTLQGSDSMAGWQLDSLDLEIDPAAPPPAASVSVQLAGRSPLGQGISKALQDGITRWIAAEHARDATTDTGLPRADEQTLTQLGNLIGPLDLVSASLDGIREQLLGITYVGVIDRGAAADALPKAAGAPTPLFGGTLRLDELRLVDAFGRVLEVPAAAIGATVTTLDLEVSGGAGTIRMRPRIQNASRWLFRLVDPAQPADTAPADLHEAYVDQLDPAGAVNPVAGFLLPDHIDEELEAFEGDGTVIGELGHDSISGAVTWDPAPARPLPPDAGPLAGLAAQARITGQIAAGLVQADALARSLPVPPASSALTALLRAIDTTLWTVDTYAAVGSPTVAGLVGRPVAVVRAALRLDAPDDLADVDVGAPGSAAARRAAFAALTEQRFPVRLGAVTRSDDALLGFYVDDDYSRLRLVDKVIAAQARASGPHVGQLGLLGDTVVPDVDPLDHPYLVPDGTLWLRGGQTVMLTLLMLPVGRVHLTSGVLPRKHLALSDDWVTPGLRRLVPSVRVGPVLVDPAEIRFPLVTLLGDKQAFTRRTGALTWKDDPILAATQTAYLPRLAHEAQEGWIRVAPAEPGGGAGSGGAP